ncbi:MAG: phosphoglucosamine mutase, partial [Peptococcaceae bacterium]
PTPSGAAVGRVITYPEGAERYSSFIKGKVDGDLSGLRVVADCANGAASYIAPRLLRELGADVTVICNQPDGININDRCGSTHLQQLQSAVVAQQADLGIAYDGDADRLLAVDEHGNVVDGDRLLLIFGRYLKEQGLLAEDTVVITVMSNMGLKIALKEQGIQTLDTKVGDRYVIEGMKNSGAVLGGEQSGHIVFGLDNTTGDGILSSVKLLQILKYRKKSLSVLAEEMEQYPQILINVKVKQKNGWQDQAEIQQAIAAAQQQLGDAGRILVRASGTENLLRVMVEGKEQTQIEQLAAQIADVVKVVMN